MSWGLQKKLLPDLILNMYKLYLDDIRDPPDKSWVVVRSYKEFREIIIERGLPYEMSLDHDLGSFSTGYDTLNWLISNKYDLRIITIHIHSNNPVGSTNMRALINNWRNFLEENN